MFFNLVDVAMTLMLQCLLYMADLNRMLECVFYQCQANLLYRNPLFRDEAPSCSGYQTQHLAS